MLKTHTKKIKGFGSLPFHAGGLFCARRDLKTASGLGVAEIENAGYDLADLSRRSKTIRQALGYDHFLGRQLNDMAKNEVVSIA